MYPTSVLADLSTFFAISNLNIEALYFPSDLVLGSTYSNSQVVYFPTMYIYISFQEEEFDPGANLRTGLERLPDAKPR